MSRTACIIFLRHPSLHGEPHTYTHTHTHTIHEALYISVLNHVRDSYTQQTYRINRLLEATVKELVSKRTHRHTHNTLLDQMLRLINRK